MQIFDINLSKNYWKLNIVRDKKYMFNNNDFLKIDFLKTRIFF